MKPNQQCGPGQEAGRTHDALDELGAGAEGDLGVGKRTGVSLQLHMWLAGGGGYESEVRMSLRRPGHSIMRRPSPLAIGRAQEHGSCGAGGRFTGINAAAPACWRPSRQQPARSGRQPPCPPRWRCRRNARAIGLSGAGVQGQERKRCRGASGGESSLHCWPPSPRAAVLPWQQPLGPEHSRGGHDLQQVHLIVLVHQLLGGPLEGGLAAKE